MAALKTMTSAVEHRFLTKLVALFDDKCSATSTLMQRSNRAGTENGDSRSTPRKSISLHRSEEGFTQGPSIPTNVPAPNSLATASHEPCPQPTSTTVAGL